MNEEEIKVSWETYIGFPATAGEIEVQGDPQVFKCLQFITEAFSGKLPQGVLVPLGCLFHLPFLQDTWRANTWWGRGENQKEKRKNVGKRSRPRHPPDTPTIAVLWLKSSLLINHTYNKQTSSDKTHTHTNKLHMTGLSFLLQTQSVKCQTSITAPLLSAMKHAHRFIVYIYLSKKKEHYCAEEKHPSPLLFIKKIGGAMSVFFLSISLKQENHLYCREESVSISDTL